MSLDFEFNFEKRHEGKEGKASDVLQKNENYPASPHVRNICFVLADGKRIFFSYSYLISGEYNPDESTIQLSFTTHEVTLKGHALENLYLDLLYHLPKQITCSDERYNEVNKGSKYVVNDIVIVPKE